MKIALLGYGKMGRAIEALALEAGHEVTLRIDLHNQHERAPAYLRQTEVAIEFSRPESAFGNVLACLEAGLPVVCGTTGWLDQLERARELCREKNGAFLYASNFSVGVNLFFALNRYLARLMNDRPDYAPRIDEIHHIHKFDAPSGTAISLAQDMIAACHRLTRWTDKPPQHTGELPVFSQRLGETPGTHTVTFNSAIDTISIRHEAHSREGFARGALAAAEWIVGKKGVFGMDAVLGL
jgi:4-hydroxy-tetrahydrodipicolinate reductase